MQGLENLADASFTNLLSEQQHGTIAGVCRHHPDLEMTQACERAHVLLLQKLVPKPNEDEARRHKLFKSLQKIKRRFSCLQMGVGLRG